MSYKQVILYLFVDNRAASAPLMLRHINTVQVNNSAVLAYNSTPSLRQNQVQLISVNSSIYHRAIGLIQIIIYFSMHRLIYNARELQ